MLKKPLVVFFDLDNTLYRFDKTVIDQGWIKSTIAAAMKALPGMPLEELQVKCTNYHTTVGMVPTGLAHDLPPGTFDPIQFVKDSHKFSYEGVVPCSRTSATLSKLAAIGHNLWVFTNGDMGHAETILDLMDLRTFFMDGEELKCVDLLKQWEGVPIPEIFNKPSPAAYGKALALARQSHVDPAKCVMVEDTYSNLAAPAAMGWKTIWLSYGRAAPSNFDFTPTCVVDSFDTLEEAGFLFE